MGPNGCASVRAPESDSGADGRLGNTGREGSCVGTKVSKLRGWESVSMESPFTFDVPFSSCFSFEDEGGMLYHLDNVC
jgi:hypothetical protein